MNNLTNYGKIPHNIKYVNLSPVKKLILWEIFSFEFCYKSKENLARDLGISRKAVRQYVDELVADGWIIALTKGWKGNWDYVNSVQVKIVVDKTQGKIAGDSVAGDSVAGDSVLVLPATQSQTPATQFPVTGDSVPGTGDSVAGTGDSVAENGTSVATNNKNDLKECFNDILKHTSESPYSISFLISNYEQLTGSKSKLIWYKALYYYDTDLCHQNGIYSEPQNVQETEQLMYTKRILTKALDRLRSEVEREFAAQASRPKEWYELMK